MWDQLRKFLSGQTDAGEKQQARIGPADPYSRPLPMSDEFNARFTMRKSVPQMLGLETDMMDPLQGMTPMSGHILEGQAARIAGSIPKPVRNKYATEQMPSQAQKIYDLVNTPAQRAIQRLKKLAGWEDMGLSRAEAAELMEPGRVSKPRDAGHTIEKFLSGREAPFRSDPAAYEEVIKRGNEMARTRRPRRAYGE